MIKISWQNFENLSALKQEILKRSQAEKNDLFIRDLIQLLSRLDKYKIFLSFADDKIKLEVRK